MFMDTDRKLLSRPNTAGTVPAGLPTRRTTRPPFQRLCKEHLVNKDQIKGGAKDMAGKAQEKIGQATDNRSQQAKGLMKQGEGKVQKGVGNVKDAARDATRDTDHDK
jgi:uncharacterized protein YjbJ (UPF0337 family)